MTSRHPVKRSDGSTEEVSRADARLMLRALRMGWLVDEKKHREIVEKVTDIALGSEDSRLTLDAVKTLQEGAKLDLARVNTVIRKEAIERGIEEQDEQPEQVVIVMSPEANRALLDRFKEENL